MALEIASCSSSPDDVTSGKGDFGYRITGGIRNTGNETVTAEIEGTLGNREVIGQTVAVITPGSVWPVIFQKTVTDPENNPKLPTTGTVNAHLRATPTDGPTPGAAAAATPTRIGGIDTGTLKALGLAAATGVTVSAFSY